MATRGLALTLGLAFLSMLGAALGAEYDYSGGSKGQLHWGNLKEEWRSCNSGSIQSPVDVNIDKVIPFCSARLLRTNYSVTSAKLTSLDHDIAVEFGSGAGYLNFDGVIYHLKEFHVHAPSEHTLDGKSFSLETHLVHKTADSKIAVVAIFYEIGENDTFIEQIEHLLPAVSKQGEANIHSVDPRILKVSEHRYFQYSGSLTSPPCREGVIWNILEKPRTLSLDQIKLIEDAMEGKNNRYTQDMNGRQILYFK